mgnify:FL=1
MDLTKKWHRSEFVSHEMLEVHRGIECELDFYSAIANGEIELVQENCNEQAFTNPEGMGGLSTDALRNIRYHYVVTVALITRFCVHEGLEQEKAYNLSDFYILEMDKCKTIEQISKLHDVMCLDFCKHMHEIKNSQVLSKQVVLCLDYIYSHTHYRITIREVAEYLRLSESYLSRLFKKEMGISFSQYILNLKIDKAKNLLRFSEYSIGEITYYLGFSNESHFIQTFQKRVGETPNRYRRRCFRTEWELKQN